MESAFLWKQSSYLILRVQPDVLLRLTGLVPHDLQNKAGNALVSENALCFSDE